jgi:hypothetical protein
MYFDRKWLFYCSDIIVIRGEKESSGLEPKILKEKGKGLKERRLCNWPFNAGILFGAKICFFFVYKVLMKSENCDVGGLKCK